MDKRRTLMPEEIREFVVAAHFDLEKVKLKLDERPDLLEVAYAWSETDQETAIMAAAHVGNVPIAEFLLAHRAPLAIYTAAMLGRRAAVTEMLDKDPALISARGSHGIPLLAHAALSGDVELVQMLVARGAKEGASFALHNAVSRGHEALARWLLENTRPDLAWKNFEGKTALAVALGQGNASMAELMREHGATE
jgi:ankyrin repeat protein